MAPGQAAQKDVSCAENGGSAAHSRSGNLPPFIRNYDPFDHVPNRTPPAHDPNSPAAESMAILSESGLVDDYILKELCDLGLPVAPHQHAIDMASADFGGIYSGPQPQAVILPRSAGDVQKAVAYGRRRGLKVAARGNGHSIYGQAQAPGGLVLDMRGVKLDSADERGSAAVGVEVWAQEGYVEAAAGQLWIDVLRACLEENVAPVTWPDYLQLTVGGTIQTGGVGGQSFKHGPVISNVLQMEVVTGLAELKLCDAEQNAELFYAMLGGLGQFGIITKARIRVGRPPTTVRWMRLVYAEAEAFADDQAAAVLAGDFDYVEGFVVCNNADDLVNGWAQLAFTPGEPVRLQDPALITAATAPFLYCLELAKHYPENVNDDAPAAAAMDEVVNKLEAPLKHIRGLTFSKDVPYIDFLNRVYVQELALRELGMWQIPHPWLNIFIPRSHIQSLDTLVFKAKLTNGIGGPMLMYPMLKCRWIERSSVITPNEDIFYIISLLRSNYNDLPLEEILQENDEIIHILESQGIPFKVYMPQFKSPPIDSQLHFGKFWEFFVYLKQTYDPLDILAPGQQIFQLARTSSS